MIWSLGQRVRVGSGKTIWTIVEFTNFRTVDSVQGVMLDTHASLQRIDRADVHTTCSLDRLTIADRPKHDYLS